MQQHKLGRVKWYDSQKGYGFIIPDDGGPDVFVHVSSVIWAGADRLNEGDRVSYDPKINERTGKTAASDLKIVERAETPASVTVQS